MWACGFQSWPDPASALETTAQAQDQFLSLRLLLQNVPMSLIKQPPSAQVPVPSLSTGRVVLFLL